MNYVRGDKLTPQLQRWVLAKYVHRWTHENAQQTYGGRCPACAQVSHWPYVCGQALPDGPHVYTQEQWHAYHSPLISDAEWLAAHSFAVTKYGRLDERQKFAEPACMAELTCDRCGAPLQTADPNAPCVHCYDR